ncbi:DUF2312 domain-containing protein [Sphingomonas sp. 8AM]|uniref:DUF2312 domain-containing protein n=1 Tax=Sphingomonas sp. 8AM TaxID=2653170 RepID=UPI0012EF79E1|nr:DUF2312 domain-containing protein [Sphingomonas sp. 8AM]VXC80170.1 conserved hypothetical protein [Sphingomonas sp. 8AM]
MRTMRGPGGAVVHVPTPIVAKPAGGRKRKARPAPDPIKTNGETAAEELRLLIERAERMAEEIKGMQDDLADVLAEAKSRGYDAKAIRDILNIRKQRREEYQEHACILETYMQSLGML